MTLARGTIEMLELADAGPRGFEEFTQIKIGGKKLSSATVSKRLKELVALKILGETVVHSASGRKIVGYQTTARGKKILELAREIYREMEGK